MCKRIGALLGQILRDHNISQRRFAVMLGVSEGHVSKIIRGHQALNLHLLNHWAQELGYEFEIHLVKVGTGRLPDLMRRRGRRRR